MANQSFIHNFIPSVASGKACVSDSLSVLRTMGTACHYSCELDPFSGREAACPFSKNAVSAWVDGGVRTSGASHFLFSFDPLHFHLCLIPPLLSPLPTLDKMIVFVTLHTLPFGFSFLLPKHNPFKECQMSSSHTNLPLAPPTPTPILPASRNTTSFFMSNYSHRGATVKRQRRYSCQKGFELQEAMNYSKPFFNSPQKWNVRACCCIFLSTISYRPLQELDRGQTLFCIMIFLFLRLSFSLPPTFFCSLWLWY